MIICVCHGVSDRTIRTMVRQGCNTVRDVHERTGAGGSCGSCACDLKRMLRENRTNSASPATSAPVGALLR